MDRNPDGARVSVWNPPFLTDSRSQENLCELDRNLNFRPERKQSMQSCQYRRSKPTHQLRTQKSL